MECARPSRWLLVLLAGLFAPPVLAGPIRTGFDTSTLPATDDGSSDANSLGFAVNFLGQTFSSIFVNNNGNLSFGSPLADFTPVPLGQLRYALVAPFFADVDTTAAGTVTFGTGSVDGRAAFGATWSSVDYYGGNGTRGNTFQAVLVDRSDTGSGNFDLELNYGSIQWESGDFNGGIGGVGGSSARVGFTNGSAIPGTFYELPGSGVPGSFLDGATGGTALFANNWNSDTPGRYVFEGRDGAIAGQSGGSMPPPKSSGPPPTGGPIGVPEPSTLVLSALAFLSLGCVRFRGRLGV